MSGYIHTIGFKVLIDSEVVDFTFRVPRGTLLIQIMDELQTTLRIEPRIIATINHVGEIVVIENHYSTIDFLVQKHGTEFYAGDSSVVTFNHGEYVIDLEVPEAIPYAATYRTACKSFSIKIRDVAIERQDGQVMDAEVFSMPTAFVLNSWGNFYRIVDKDLGDSLVELAEKDPSTSEKDDQVDVEDTMVYPPKMEELDIVEIASKLVEVSESEQAEVDTITDHYLDSFEDQEKQKESAELDEEVSELIDKVEEEISPQYPWEQLATVDEEPLIDTQELEIVDKKSIVEEVFKGIMADEAQEKTLHESPLDVFDSEDELTIDEDVSDVESIDIIDDEQLVEDLEPEDQIESFDLPAAFEEEEVEEEQDTILVSDETPVFKGEPMLNKINELKRVIEDIDIQADLTEPTIEKPIVETEDTLLVEEPEIVETMPEPFAIDEDLPLDERLAKRKKELETLKTALKAEEKVAEKLEQRSIGLEYYERMHPQKVYPLIIRIPPPSTNGNEFTEVKVQPIFPGCYVTPSEEIISLDDENVVSAEFSITPLIGRGKVNGRVGLWYRNKNIFAVNTPSVVASVFWQRFTTSIGLILGLIPFIVGLFTELNTKIADGINNTITANMIMWIELGVFLAFLFLTMGLFFGKRPLKKSANMKFYPVNLENNE